MKVVKKETAIMVGRLVFFLRNLGRFEKKQQGKDLPAREKLWRILDMRTDSLSGMSVRVQNGLARAQRNYEVTYLGDLVQLAPEKLVKQRNFGKKTQCELKELLDELGVSPGMDIKGWVAPDKRAL